MAIIIRFQKASSKPLKAIASGGVAAATPAQPAIDTKIVGVREHTEEVKMQAAPISDKDFATASSLSKFVAFQSAYKTKFMARPDVPEAELVKVTDWKLLTPEDYDRTCFHFEVDVKGTNMEHLVNGSDGKALSVYATNDSTKVLALLAQLGLNASEIISIDEIAPPEQDGTVVLTTVEKLFTQYLDVFGKPTREFLKKLSTYAVDILEKVKIAELTLDRCMDEFLDRQARSYTFADYLMEFKSLKIPVEKYIDLIPTIKQRVYSICSSSKYRPGKCQLLVVREDWQAKDGSTKYGLCSSFLTFLRSGYCIAHSTHSVMKIPEDKSVHVFMAGLGTGLAPFRAFVEERKCDKDNGHRVGGMTLFFGGRYSKAEYYYRDEFESYEKEGLVKCCNAWSRDQAKKVYVQHKIMEEADSIWEHLGKDGSTGYFFLCGSKQPEKDVYAALTEIMKVKGGLTDAKAQEKLEELQARGRYVTEVY
jgi:sulfite reductase (NADPH) flavoprotein alpha-component